MALAASVPRLQLTELVPMPVQLPAEEVMTSAEKAAGRALFSLVLKLEAGPLFVTVNT